MIFRKLFLEIEKKDNTCYVRLDCTCIDKFYSFSETLDEFIKECEEYLKSDKYILAKQNIKRRKAFFFDLN